MRYLILPLLLVMAFSQGFSQKKQKPEELFLDAEYYRLYEEYIEALPLYNKLLSQGYDNAHINYRIGECYLEIPGRKSNAIPFLEKAIENISPKFKEGSFKETSAPIYAFFYLGKAYQINNQLDKALNTYNKFLERLEDKDKYNMKFVNKQIRSCSNARELMKEPVSIKLENVGRTVNNGRSNIKPVVNNNETRMVYTSKLKFYDAVFMSEKRGENWSPPINLTPQIKSDGDLYSSSLDNDGNKLLLLKSNPYNGDLYISEYEPEKREWKKPDKMDKTINSKSWETHGSLSNDNKTIYFTSNRKGGMGGLDIYVSHYNEQKEKWGEAKNLGPNVNTPYNEETPFLTKDGSRLYFSSQGHYNMGGFDIFYVEKLGDGSWSEPINLGYPVNTTDDDLFFFPVQNGKAGYLAKFEEESYGGQDIYRVEFNPPKEVAEIKLKGIINPDVRKPVEKEKLDLSVKTPDGSILTPKISDSLTFSAIVNPGEYKLSIKAEGFATINKNISIGEDYQRQTYEIQAYLQPEAIKIKNFINIDNIYFNFDSYQLTEDAKSKLNELTGIMKKYNDLNIDVVGHTDAKGNDAYNKRLSENRAESVKKYLINKGIPDNRISTSAKGEEYPLAINTFQDGKDCEEGRKYNRRVEIIPSSSENKYIIRNTAEVPNDLKKRGTVYYSVLLLRRNSQLPKDYFSRYEPLKDYTIKEYYNGEYLYILGKYENQNEAIEPYKKALEMGFSKARILSSYQLKDILNIQIGEQDNANIINK